MLVGALFYDFQKFAWTIFGLVYLLIGCASGTPMWQGFSSMALFGLALSAPIAVANFFEVGAKWLDRLSGLSRAVPRLTGTVLILLGLWSIWSGLRVGTSIPAS